MTGKPIPLFLNPTAGRGRAGRRRKAILDLFEDAHVDVALHTSRSVGDLEDQVLQQVNDGAERIIVAGGDGSIHEATNGILRADKVAASGVAALGVIPTGTGNDFAKACGIPLRWEHATRLLADRIAANVVARPIDAGQMNERYFANGAGIGFDAKVTRIARSIRLPIGDLVYLFAIFKAMFDGIATPRVHIVSDGFTWDGPVTLASISNGPWIGGLFHIAPMANNADNVLELLIARPVTRMRILTLLPKLMNGSHMNAAEIVHQSLTDVKIRVDQPVASHLDGEVQPLQSEFELSVLPGALRLL